MLQTKQEAHNNLGNALERSPGRLPDAIREYQAALRINPAYTEAHFNLGDALPQIPGRSAEAVAEYRAAARPKPDYASLANQRIRMLAAGPLSRR